MPNPIVHFEIMGADGKQTQNFYSTLFGWNVDANNEWKYGMVDKAESGVGGGIGSNPNNANYVTIYVAVPDPPGIAPVSLEINLHKGIWIEGKVTDKETGKPVEGGRLQFLPFLDNAFAQATPEFGKNGASIQLWD